MTPTPPAAAAVEKIVRECARNAYAMTQNFAPGCSIECREELAPIIHRAVRDAIAATGAREALEHVVNTYDPGPIPAYEPTRADWAVSDCADALANLDVVMGKEMK